MDIVVLADCSGSMACDDIPDEEGQRYLTRMEALQRALRDVSRLPGRFALAAFTTEFEVVFPGTGTMADLGDGKDLREAVALLRCQEKGTDLGKALYRAADLLHRYGVPGNDSLMVLVSDGTDWRPHEARTTGEVIPAAADPVLLTADLHRSLGVRLHTLGIGDEAMFQRWWDRQRREAEPPEFLRPNHRLLAELARAGGGEPTRSGGLDVLERYFAGLSSPGS
ncbi:vWA domain-containing protein [Actinoplanes flavus]|uniref:VWA domain-containing protein n=1 Tax=Actinoplanes flavus TaxID=2820290 RepID=A0ABS3UXD2_9ACTN|nr:vWA domain-containing protein [Actinoplanes flavus]MBO3743235.1 VWA domain-containing protein [Actinoplanes flavus]